MSLNSEKFQSAVAISLKNGISETDFYQKNVYQNTMAEKQKNIHPKDISVPELKKCITLETLIPSESGSKNSIKETYIITPKTLINQLEKCNDSVSPIYLLKFGNGNFALKFHYPDAYSNTEYNNFYMTYCKKNTAFITGYEDYKEGVLPVEFVNAMSIWANKLPVNTKTKLSTTTPNNTSEKTWDLNIIPTKYKNIIFNYTGNGISKYNGILNNITIGLKY